MGGRTSLSLNKISVTDQLVAYGGVHAKRNAGYDLLYSEANSFSCEIGIDGLNTQLK
jgi:hypothetical protein